MRTTKPSEKKQQNLSGLLKANLLKDDDRSWAAVEKLATDEYDYNAFICLGGGGGVGFFVIYIRSILLDERAVNKQIICTIPFLPSLFYRESAAQGIKSKILKYT